MGYSGRGYESHMAQSAIMGRWGGRTGTLSRQPVDVSELHERAIVAAGGVGDMKMRAAAKGLQKFGARMRARNAERRAAAEKEALKE